MRMRDLRPQLDQATHAKIGCEAHYAVALASYGTRVLAAAARFYRSGAVLTRMKAQASATREPRASSSQSDHQAKPDGDPNEIAGGVVR